MAALAPMITAKPVGISSSLGSPNDSKTDYRDTLHKVIAAAGPVMTAVGFGMMFIPVVGLPLGAFFFAGGLAASIDGPQNLAAPYRYLLTPIADLTKKEKDKLEASPSLWDVLRPLE
jgi:hypothetical protein